MIGSAAGVAVAIGAILGTILFLVAMRANRGKNTCPYCRYLVQGAAVCRKCHRTMPWAPKDTPSS